MGGPDLSMFDTLIGTLQDQMGVEEGMQAPEGIPVPEQTNPFAAMGATFAASMADQLGGRRQHLAGVQSGLADQEKMAQAIEFQNVRDQREFAMEKRGRMLQYLEKMNDVKLARADAESDWEGARAAALEALQLEDKKHTLEKEMWEFRHGLKMDEIEREGQYKAAASGHVTTPGQVTREGINTLKEIDEIFADEKSFERHGRITPFPVGGYTGLTPAKKAAVISSSQQLLASSEPADRIAGAEAYLRAHLDTDGNYQHIDMDSDAFATVVNSLVETFGEEATEQWLISKGLQPAPAAPTGTAPTLAPDTTNTPAR